MLSNTRSLVRQTPSGSMSSKCLDWPFFIPVRTNCPRVFCEALTRKSPSFFRRDSDNVLGIDPWNHFSDNSLECGDVESKNTFLYNQSSKDIEKSLQMLVDDGSAKTLSSNSSSLASFMLSCSIVVSRSIKLLEMRSRGFSFLGDFVNLVFADSGGAFPGMSL